jgi:hypothetical protein
MQFMVLSTVFLIVFLAMQAGVVAGDLHDLMQVSPEEGDESSLPTLYHVRHLQTNSTGRACASTPIAPFLNGGPITIDGSSLDWRKPDGALDNKYFLANIIRGPKHGKITYIVASTVLYIL